MLSRLLARVEGLIDPFAPFDERQTPPGSVAGFAWFYLRPVRGWLVVLFLASLAVGILESSLYVLMGWLVDLLGRTAPEALIPEHGPALLGAALLVLVGRPLLLTIHEVLTNQIVVSQTTTLIRWRTHVYTLGHSLSYFQGDFAGRIANRVISAGYAIREIATTLLDTLVYVGVFAVAAVGLFLRVSPLLALPMVAWIVAYVLLLRHFVPRATALSMATAEQRSATTGRVVDGYTNVLTVKLFARDRDEVSGVRGALDRWTRANLASFRLITGTTAALALLNSLLLAAVAGLSLRLWSQGAMSPGEASAGLALVLRILAMSGWVMQTVRGVFENVGVVQESMNTIARPHGLVDAPDAVPLVPGRGEVRFEAVRFHYGKGSGVIDDLTLTVRAGERVGLVGPSGAGKSTLVGLLLRLHDAEGGRVLLDGQDVTRVTQESLRRAVAVVTQDTSLLHRSIRDNIAYGRPGASDAEVERAARLADADGFIAGLVDQAGRRGYDSHVGERGVKLSGGQRQRIAIARVLLKDAPVLVLDEATSALDSEAEAAIQASLERVMAGKTVIAVAHRLSTIRALDRLVVLRDGRIVEEGDHDALVARGGLYARLWARQSGGFIGRQQEAAE